MQAFGRASWITAASLLAAVSLSGCDWIDGKPQQTVAVAVPAAPCNCRPAAAPEPLTRLSYAAPRRVRHHDWPRSYSSGGNYRHREHYSHGEGYVHGADAVDSYGYVSASRVDYTETSESSGAYEEDYARGGAYAGSHRYYRGDIAWVDGYGRGYYRGGAPTVAQSMTGKRLAPYHGYDVDCPDPGQR
jgi:hypothetical protein